MINRLYISALAAAFLVSAGSLKAIENQAPTDCKNWLKDIEENNYRILSTNLRLSQPINGQENELWLSQKNTYLSKQKTLVSQAPKSTLCQKVASNLKHSDQEKSENILNSPWQMEAMEFLQEEYLEAKRMPPLRWKNWSQLFGKAVELEFFSTTFHSGRYLASVEKKVVHPDETKFELIEIDLAKPVLTDAKNKSSDAWKKIFVTEYGKIEEQAKELHLLLRNRIDEIQNKKIILLSRDYNSAIIVKLIDLYPEWRNNEQILGWLNFDGDLFPKNLAAQELQISLLETPMPLGSGFPVINLLQKKRHTEPRLAIISEGDTLFLDQKEGAEAVIKQGINRLAQTRPN